MSSDTQVPDNRTTLHGGDSRLISHSLTLTFDAQGLHNHTLEQVQNMVLHRIRKHSNIQCLNFVPHTTLYYTLVLGTSDTWHIYVYAIQ